jgi:hypothetical protein
MDDSQLVHISSESKQCKYARTPHQQGHESQTEEHVQNSDNSKT